MGLRIIYGRAGSGKSSFCIDDMRERLKENSSAPLILLVPEQYSLQAEKKLVKIIGGAREFKSDHEFIGNHEISSGHEFTSDHEISSEHEFISSQNFFGRHKFVDEHGSTGMQESMGPAIVEVLSFRRMAYRVFNEVGGVTRKHISAAGKSMIISKILNKKRNDLKVFYKAATQPGFIKTICDIISELKRYNITPSILKNSALNFVADNLLRIKLDDLSLIYEEFEDFIKKDYLDVDDDLTLLANRIEKSNLLNGAEIWIDEFSGFTPQEYAVIEGLLSKASRVNICLCCDFIASGNEYDYGSFGDSTSDIFTLVKNTAKKLINIAKDNSVEIERPIFLKGGEKGRFKETQELSWLEDKLFSLPIKPYIQNTERVSILSAENTYAEVEEVAKDIISLCRDNGLRFRDIAVVTGNLDEYESLVRVIFSEYEISFFIDKKKDIMSNQLMVMIASLFQIFLKNWSYESVFRYLKTGLTNISINDIDIIENYVLAFGIRGNAWTEDARWTRIIEAYGSRSDGEVENSEELERINSLRLKIIEPLIKFRQHTKGSKKISEMCIALFDFLCEIGVPKTIQEKVDDYKSRGELNNANEYTQIWNIIMELIDQTVKVSGEESTTLREFSELLVAGASEYQIGLIPPSLDEVLVGSVERSKSHEIKALYILGVNDGVFPAVDKQEGILTDRDREMLKIKGVELAPDTTLKIFEEQYRVYSVLASPTDYLKLSYPAADVEGRALRPSYIITKIKKLFLKIEEVTNISSKLKEGQELKSISVVTPSFNGLVEALRRQADGIPLTPLWQDAYKWFAQDEKWKNRLSTVVAGLDYSCQVNSIQKDKVRKLYGGSIYSSISRMEQYASCPYSYFVKYGLKARERKIFALRAPDIGTFIHDILEKFTEKVLQSQIGWKNIERKWCEDAVSSITDEFMQNMTGSVFAGSERSKYIVSRLKRVINRAVWIIVQHLAKSSFSPLGSELSFGKDESLPPITVSLTTGEEIKLVGRIDRVDIMKSDKGTYIRIIDYKSGKKDFKLSDIFYGLDIQLIAYLDALLENSGGNFALPLIPAGVLYFNIDDPIIKDGTLKEQDEIEKEIMKKLKMKGLVLDDIDIIKAMDIEIDGDSLIIPVKINKTGLLSSTSGIATVQQFEILRNHVKKLLVKLGDEMLSGNVSISPYEKKSKNKNKRITSCTFCEYASVCQFDTVLKGNEYRKINEMKNEEFWKAINPDIEV